MDYRDARRCWKLIKGLRQHNDNLPCVITMQDGSIQYGAQAEETRRQCLNYKFADPSTLYPEEWEQQWPIIAGNIERTIASLPVAQIDPSKMRTLYPEDFRAMRNKLSRNKKYSSDLTANDLIREMPDEEFDALVECHWLPLAHGQASIPSASKLANLICAFKKGDPKIEANHRALTQQSHNFKFGERVTKARSDRAIEEVLHMCT
jgi:hypothetical protein